MCALAVGSASRSMCFSMRRLRCASWAAALRTASSWRCAAAFIVSSACLMRCCCRACVIVPLMFASLIRGSLKRRSLASCAWLWVDPPSCFCRLSAGDQPTSVSLPACRWHILKCFQSSGMVWSHGQQMCSSGTWMCLQASHQATLVRNGSCSLRSSMRHFCRWDRTYAWRTAEW